MKYITIKGAREHNLKNINLKLPRNKFIVITGLSGSGKSSLAFDTIYAEGERRYLESLSAYARQFLQKIKKSDVDYVGGLSPAISIEQRQIAHNPRSTVGTVTEIYDYLRLLFAKVGDVYCYNCGSLLGFRDKEDILNVLYQNNKNARLSFYSPIVQGRKGEFKSVFASLLKKGFSRVRIDGVIYDLNNIPKLKKNSLHTVELLIDRLKINEKSKVRVKTAIKLQWIFLKEYV